jgi:membrane protein DedA with SNARE-associated domain
MDEQPKATGSSHPHADRTHKIPDGVAFGLLGAYLISRQITQRIGLGLGPKIISQRPWVIPLLNNSSILLLQAGVGTSGRPGMFAATMLASVFLSTVVGLIMYWAGWRFGHVLAEKAKEPGSPWAGVWNPKQIAKAERRMDRYGMFAVFIARATEFFTLPVNLVAGASEMAIRRFVIAHTAGAIAFAAFWLWLGGVAQRRWPGLQDWIENSYGPWALRISLVLLVLLVVVMFLGRLVKPKPDEAAPQDETTTPSQPGSESPSAD